MKIQNMDEFAELLLATLASKSTRLNAYLPSQYKQTIEDILCSHSIWRKKYSQIINMEEYFIIISNGNKTLL